VTEISNFEMRIAHLRGAHGFVRKGGFPAAPVVLALVLTPLMETVLQQSLQISHGSLAIFFTRPIAASLVIIGLASLGCRHHTAPPCCSGRQPSVAEASIDDEETSTVSLAVLDQSFLAK
jgi:putative tricarboxylic transport membrane protein